MKSDKKDAIDAIGKLKDAEISELYGNCDAESEGVKRVTRSKDDERRDAMIDAIADDYLDDADDLPIGDWFGKKLPKMTP